MSENLGTELDLSWINHVYINVVAVHKQAKKLISSRVVTGEYCTAWILKALTCIDLTTLCGDDTESNVKRLCVKACHPLSENIVEALGFQNPKDVLHPAAVCVYSSKVETAVKSLKRLGFENKINVASVAAGFPAGQTPLNACLEEIRYAVDKGAKEIDIVIDRALVLRGEWSKLYDEIREMKKACGPGVHMKTILAVGELCSLENIYKSSMVAMMAGSDFIKTSTGKENINATIPFGIVMSRAIVDYYEKTGYKVGLKPAGGIKTYTDAINWLVLVKELLGDEWLTPKLFRIGASGLLGNIEQYLYKYVYGCTPASYEFAI